jgi:DNA polymerase III delta subunit
LLNVLYLSGSKFYIDDYLNKIKENLKPDNVVKINGAQADVENDICLNMTIGDPFGMNNLFLINGLPIATKKTNGKPSQDLIMDCFDRVPDCNFVVFYTYGNARHDRFKKALKKIKGASSVKSFKDSDNITADIVKIVEKYKKIASSEVVDFIAGYFSSDLSVIEQELGKLNYYLGKTRTIKELDIIEVCIPNSDFVIWNFLNHMGSKNLELSLEHLHKFLYTGGSHEQVLGMLQREIRLNLSVKECILKNIPESKIYDKVKEIKKVVNTENSNNIMYSDFEIKKSIKFSTSFSKNYTLENLLQAYVNLRDASLRVRCKYSSEDKDKELALSLYSICYPAFSLEFESGLLYVE